MTEAPPPSSDQPGGPPFRPPPPPPPPSGDQPGGPPFSSPPPPPPPPPPPTGGGYGAPPPADYGSQPGYGTAPSGYGYGSPQAYGAQVPAQGTLAEWGQRALSYLIDLGIVLVGYIIVLVLSAILGSVSDSLGTLVLVLGELAVVGFAIWNQIILQGQTGQSIGKKQLGVKIVAEQTGQVIGPLMTFVRQLAHIVDAIPCYLGFFWPIWDPKKQTFADKIMSTVVVRV